VNSPTNKFEQRHDVLYRDKQNRKRSIIEYFLVTVVLFVFLSVLWESIAFSAPAGLNIQLGDSDDPNAVVPALKILGILSLLAIAPALLLLMTSFTRILIVLSFVRQALGTQTMPPNQVLVGLALFLTLFIMSPVLTTIYDQAYQPYIEKKISQDQALELSLKPIRDFMFSQVNETDLELFMNIAEKAKPKAREDIPTSVLIPAFLVSELKIAFQIGFLIYIPFLIIDMVVSSVLMAMGMLMLPPTVISLPFKLVLFVLVDGWGLIVGQVVRSFMVNPL
jgi:flagellar biosynthesis protein FliP